MSGVSVALKPSMSRRIRCVWLTSAAVMLAACGGGGGDDPPATPAPPAPPTPTAAARVSWAAPALRTDGSGLQDLAGFKVYYGTSPGNYTSSVTINDPAATSHSFQTLAAGRYYFAVVAIDAGQRESPYSTEVSKTVP